MKKAIPADLVIGGSLLLLLFIVNFGYRFLNPPQLLRGGEPQAMQQRQPGTQSNGKPAMSSQPSVGDFTK